MFSYPPVKKVSVVIPVYNEQESLPELIRRTDTACATLGRQYEILLVDEPARRWIASMRFCWSTMAAAMSLPVC